MAGLRGLMILLVLMVGLASCEQDASSTSPPSISNETSTTNQSSPQNNTSPPSTQPNTTMAATTAKPIPKCSYSVETIQSGFLIKMIDSTPGNYTIDVAEKEGSFERKNTVFLPSKNSTHEIKSLKPCTEYKLEVTLSGINGTDLQCNKTENTATTKTTGMTKEDIKNTSCPSGYFCYQSGWDISSLSSKHNKVSAAEFISGSYRFKPAYEDICSDFVLEFPPKNCSNVFFTISEYVPVDFIDPNDIKQTEPTKLPANINATLPSTCYDLSVEYKCSDMDNNTVEPSNMKPFTVYSCTGDIKNNNVFINKTTKPVQFSIDCDFTINSLQSSSTNTSIKINWETTSDKCQGVLDNLDELSYNCSCRQDRNERRYIVQLHGPGGSKQNLTECEFEFKDLSYLTSYTVEVFTFNGHFESTHRRTNADTRYNDKALIGFLVFLIIITSVALLLVLYKIYVLKHRKSHDLTENMSLITQGNDEESLMPVEPIPAELLLETYKRKLADEGRLFLGEFQSIPRIFSRYTVKEAKKGCNTPKNRYVDILPYDYNRVQLATGNGEAGCDYINASFIDGFKEPKKYIAAQGPKEETVSDFWRMIWEQQSSIIVMVTRCEEGSRIKCAQYWPSPERETEIYDEFIVKLTSEDHCPDYTIRHLSLTNKREKNLEREVTHIQFMSWPDHGVPGEPHLLLKLRRRVNAFKNVFSGPIVVHCSAGVGRTGTYIGIDAMMEGLEAEGRVDIYGYVVRLRRQRCLMVQVEAQYILIHQALLEHNQFGETEITLSELHSTLSTLKQKNSDSEPTLMEEEFERLPSFKNWRTFNTGITEENKKKNRSSSIIPYDYNRVLLRIEEGNTQDSEADDEEPDESSDEEDEDSTKYINASHINGYWGPRSLITAQDPLPDTFADFWLMVCQKKLSTIVMLSEHKEDGERLYWSKEKETFGDFEVEVSSTEITPVFITRNMLVRHVKRKESREVKHFQFLKWKGTDLPEKPQELIDMAKEIKRNCVGSKSQRMPIVVHCNDGSTRSGIFCALWNLLDSAETEKLVDVFQVVKTLRKERKGMITSLEQYQFLYKALEDAFPVQNGELKQVKGAAASVQIVNETKSAEAEKQPEEKADEPASTTSSNQQAEAESTPLVAESEKEKKEEEPAKESSAPKEPTPQEETSNGPTVTVEV
ncbi:receptor-type tyrosine-protein phosphatase C [Anableps anableps]